MDPEMFKLLRDAGIPSGFLALLLYMQWQKKNEPPAGQRLPQGLPEGVLQMLADHPREVSRLLDEFNRSEGRADRRHDEAMDAIRNVIDELRDIKEAQKRTTDAA